ncbi:hypothetical protein BDZ91DRAFT_418849 [Kalaharituber pfeilii]|nr:hypothetical protein BDZ91DRAFT_418849 [Kalaharituber pfeilii]
MYVVLTQHIRRGVKSSSFLWTQSFVKIQNKARRHRHVLRNQSSMTLRNEQQVQTTNFPTRLGPSKTLNIPAVSH